jgi:hypothetical protein
MPVQTTERLAARGLALVRDVIGVEPIASTRARATAEAVAATLTRYLLAPLNSER